MSAEVTRVLRAAADLIESEGAWTTGAWARDADGVSVFPDEPSAVCWCAEGAIARVAGDGLAGQETAEVINAVEQHIGRGIVTWNDTQRAARPVVAALRRAADIAEARP